MSEIEVNNPFTGDIVKKLKLETFDQVTLKANHAQRAQESWAKEPLSKRLATVRAGLDYFANNSDQIAHDISIQMGRPRAQASGEIKGFFERANYLCEIAKSTLAPDIIEDSDKFYRAIDHCPLGVIFVISAWNYPLLITVNSVIPALLAGNTVLLKHSSQTPIIGEHFAKAFGDLGGHTHLVQQLVIDHATTGRTIEELPINHVVFTGSVSGGRKILQHTAKKFMMPQLELGGKDASFIAADADLEKAADCVVDGAFFNSGQSCCGIERAYVAESVYEEFVELCRARTEAYILGDPLDRNTNLGPVAIAKSIDLMLSQVNEAKEKGAKVVAGGNEQMINNARFMQPTVITEVDHFMSVMREENFGPILPLMKVEDVDEAISLVNDCDYGLTASIFTQDKDLASRFADEVEVGTVFMNRCDYLDPALPWTGVKDSGCGSALSKYGFLGVTRRKARHFKKKD